jgi:RNA polymerase sigma-70 factor (ECF subfamily)
MLATLIRYTGSLELAEDCLQEAMLRATTARDRELLINPAAWITTVAKRVAIDSVRRDAALRRKLPLLAAGEASEFVTDERLESPIGDDRLGLLFLACSPELAPETRLALALRFVCGIPTSDIADAMLVTHTTMSARLTRAKRQIERQGIRFSAPDDGLDAERLGDVVTTVHLLYTVGHTAFDGDELGSRPVASTAIDLARALHTLAPADSETTGLLALLLLTDARSTGRVDDTASWSPLSRPTAVSGGGTGSRRGSNLRR